MAAYSLDQVNEMYVDVLREIGNIGAGNGNNGNCQYVAAEIE